MDFKIIAYTSSVPYSSFTTTIINIIFEPWILLVKIWQSLSYNFRWEVTRKWVGCTFTNSWYNIRYWWCITKVITHKLFFILFYIGANTAIILIIKWSILCKNKIGSLVESISRYILYTCSGKKVLVYIKIKYMVSCAPKQIYYMSEAWRYDWYAKTII